MNIIWTNVPDLMFSVCGLMMIEVNHIQMYILFAHWLKTTFTCFLYMFRRQLIQSLPEVFATCLDESWTHHLQLGLTKILRILDFYNGGKKSSGLININCYKYPCHHRCNIVICCFTNQQCHDNFPNDEEVYS